MMNVLILTPDAVGSTLLQRLITIYMQFLDLDQPVINLHELTNGLGSYFCPEFNREIVSKKPVEKWGYYQSLREITDILQGVDHYKTSRLAHYHISRRGDTLAEQIPFYQYLNDNFFIIACRRQNIFEHALSMTLARVTKKLNVYQVEEKLKTFGEFYQAGIDLDEQSFIRSLEAYKEYLHWSDTHFAVSAYFNYEQDIPRIEDFILNLPMFVGRQKTLSWKQIFGIDFNDWNRCHYLRSDIGAAISQSASLDLTQSAEKLMLDYQHNAPLGWPPVHNLNDYQHLPAEQRRQFEDSRIERQGLSGGMIMSAPINSTPYSLVCPIQ